MKNYILFFLAIFTLTTFCSSDDGRIYEKYVDIQSG